MNKLWIVLVVSTGILSLSASESKTEETKKYDFISPNKETYLQSISEDFDERLNEFTKFVEKSFEEERNQLRRARAIAQRKSKGMFAEIFRQSAAMVEQTEKSVQELGDALKLFGESHPELQENIYALAVLDAFTRECFSQDVKDMDRDKHNRCLTQSLFIIASDLSQENVHQTAAQFKKFLEEKASE